MPRALPETLTVPSLRQPYLAHEFPEARVWAQRIERRVYLQELQPEVVRGVGFLAKRRRRSDDPVDAEVYTIDRVISASLYSRRSMRTQGE